MYYLGAVPVIFFENATNYPKISYCVRARLPDFSLNLSNICLQCTQIIIDRLIENVQTWPDICVKKYIRQLWQCSSLKKSHFGITILEEQTILFFVIRYNALFVNKFLVIFF
jgi:hypothetical protein